MWISDSMISYCSSVSGIPMSRPLSLDGMRSSSPSTFIRRPNAPTAPVWTPRYSSSPHRNDRVTRRCRPGVMVSPADAADSPHIIERYASAPSYSDVST